MKTQVPWLAILFAGVVLWVSSSAAAPDKGGVAHLRACLVDRKAGVAYVYNPKAGIDAVDLKTGMVLWKTKEGAKYMPLAIDKDRLIARAMGAKGLQIVAFSVSDNGAPAMTSSSLEAPGWAPDYDWLDDRVVGGAVPLGTPPRHEFESHEWIDGGKYVIAWKSRWFKGAPPMLPPVPREKPTPPGKRDDKAGDKPAPPGKADKEAQGVFEIDLASGKVTKAAKGESPAAADAPVAKVEWNGATYTVDERRNLTGSSENHQLFLVAKDAKTGKTLWEHPMRTWSIGFAP